MIRGATRPSGGAAVQPQPPAQAANLPAPMPASPAVRSVPPIRPHGTFTAQGSCSEEEELMSHRSSRERAGGDTTQQRRAREP
ncbi:hypothetical protein NDU88_002403 [Pleurodeles waltl]|uniref:Uncharacterized protein n=1 Tax=Pleurodeles waltl TaxID=8319 RepID=A0AAV7RAV1_PLEWA|nr:hypothetical protein NDU88_002403 [Pleurodeles waltl]